jgi:hypothetical protein
MLCDGMTVSGQGLVYNFDNMPAYEKAPEDKYEKYAELQSTDNKKKVSPGLQPCARLLQHLLLHVADHLV